MRVVHHIGLLALLGSTTLLPRLAHTDAVPGIRATLTMERTEAMIDEQVRVTLDVGVPADAFAAKSDPLVIDGAEVVSLERHEEARRVEGEDYRFVVTTYAVFADHPGDLELPALESRATLPVSAGGAGATANPRIRATTTPRRLVVRAAPTTPVAWLPAREVVLSDDRSGTVRRVRAGEPFTRTVTVEASGQRAPAIPPIAMHADDALRRYPEPPRLEETASLAGLHGTRIETTVFVATRSGALTLPAVTLDWWDIDARRWRQATLPAEAVDVAPGAYGRDAAETEGDRVLLPLLSGLCAILAAGHLVLARRRYQAGVESRTDVADTHTLAEPDAWRALRRALASGDPASTGPALIRWRRVYRRTTDARPEARRKTAERATLDGALQRLEEVLYRSGDHRPADLRTRGDALILAYRKRHPRHRRAWWRRRAGARRGARMPTGVLYPVGHADAEASERAIGPAGQTSS